MIIVYTTCTYAAALWYNNTMSVLVIRHGLSQANNIENFGTPAFGSQHAHLMEQGRTAAVKLRPILLTDYGIDVATTPVAASEFTRTIETARHAGFQAITSYQLLNEVDRGLTLSEKRAVRQTGVVPNEAIDAAQDLLADPPSEQIWFTHGLIIAGLCKTLGVYQNAVHRTIPQFCEIRRLPL